jgi:hypothetical protein
MAKPDDDIERQDLLKAKDGSGSSEKEQHPAPPKQPKGHKKRSVIIISIIVIVLLIIAGAAVWWFGYRDTGKMQADHKPKQSSSQSARKTTAKTKHHQSSHFPLGFNYPAHWQVQDKPDKITVTSPARKLKASSGQMVRGKIVMTIQNKGKAELDMFKQGNATAVLKSEKVSYTSPSQVQRGETFLSFLQYGGSPPNSLDGIFITGDAGYKKGQAIPKVDVAKVDPLVTVTFLKCGGSKCASTTPLSLQSAMWQQSSFQDPIRTMLTSLTITS